jgi:anti-sigma B factor antagonist
VLEIQLEESASHVLFRPVGELDAYTVSSFRDAIGRIPSHNRLVIDLSEVVFIDSAGLGAIIGGIRRMRGGGGDVAVSCSRDALVKLLHTTGLDRIVSVAATNDAALAAIATEPQRN